MKMQKPCDTCKRTECPERCFPLIDWQKSLQRAPCKGCKDRTPGCHGTCEDYITWKAALEEQKHLARIESKGERDAQEYSIDKKVKTQKYWRQHK